ncbi:MAG: peptide ABC transporter substrate-binding protein [Candidatus Eisenbacteria bacterium]|uniref:Peptide ABC transporter substrate-binding protein n=1 Tax=Eiseniibacteriota bacterium TaxID=2212470 RepID=A0A933W8U8_UNCEI|nr:peptide ABC transporter substrate-binding protein [Candidatus Eisenbacteria bacterium]
MTAQSRSHARPGVRLAAALVLALAAAACAPERDARDARDARWFGSIRPPAANVLRFNNGTEPETTDPSVMSGQPDGMIARILFEGLTEYDPQTLLPVPGQAYRWETSADGLTYTFHLRPNLVWSDGSPLTAHDFVWSWRRVLSPSTASRAAALMYPIVNAEAFNKGTLADSTRLGLAAPDDSTFVVTLRAPTPWLLFLTSYYTFVPVPRACIEKHGARWTEPGKIVNNGAFSLVSHRQNAKYVFAKNPKYWAASEVKLDGIEAYCVDDLNTSTNLYKAGVIDWNPSGYIPSPFLPYVRGFADYTTGEFQATYFYGVNCTRPPFDDPRVRRALNMAIDREAIARDLLKGTRRAWGRLTPSGYPGYDGPPHVPFAPDSARAELARAGFPGGRGFPKFTILFNTSEDHRRIAEAVQAMWKRELNVPVELQNMEWASFQQASTTLRYDVARRSWIGDYLDPSTFLTLLTTGNGNNRSGWSDPEYDRLLRESEREVDPVKRAALLRTAEARALASSPFLPIYHYSTHELIKPYVKGIFHTALDVHPLSRVWIDRDWRQHEPIASGARR